MKTALLILAGFASSALLATAAARPNKPGPLPAEEMAAIMIADYDADENDALNATELVTAFSEIRNKRRAENAADCPRDGQGRRGGPEGGRGMPPPPEELTARLMEDFDADGDAALNTSELLKALDFLHNRGPLGRGRPPVAEEDTTTAE